MECYGQSHYVKVVEQPIYVECDICHKNVDIAKTTIKEKGKNRYRVCKDCIEDRQRKSEELPNGLQLSLKVCRKCNQLLPIEQFYKTNNWYMKTCKKCHNKERSARRKQGVVID